jgi:6-phosphogluconolactonase
MRILIIFPVLLLLGLNCNSSQTKSSSNTKPEHRLYIGTYTGSGSKGIYTAVFNSETGHLSFPELAAAINNPSFQAISPDNKFLWSVSESDNSVMGYAIESETGKLELIAQSPSHGHSPCYLAFHRPTFNLCIANYSSGTTSRWKINKNGTFGKSYTQYKHEGTGFRTDRQEAPHAHCFTFDLNEKFGYSCDLGADKIYVYSLHAQGMTSVATIPTSAGFGPRHVAFHPGKKIMAVLGELDCSVSLYELDDRGIFSILVQQISTLPKGFNGKNTAADIHFSADGKFLYASNRGHNSLAMFSMNEEIKLEHIGWKTENINWPRNFRIDPTGKYLLVANQNGNNIVVFSMDSKTGKLTPTSNEIAISQPVCITFLN